MTSQEPDMGQPLLLSGHEEPEQLTEQLGERITLAVYLSLAGNVALLLAKCYVSRTADRF